MARKKEEAVPQKAPGKMLAEGREWIDPFDTFRHEMDTLMENFFGGFEQRPLTRRADTFVPHVDVVDTDKEIMVSAELPGMDEKDIEVSLMGESLTITGEKKEEKEEKGKDYYRSERSYGSFSRTIPLPADIDAEKVAASFKKGVLTIKLPKTKRAIEEQRKISIKAE